MVDIDELAGLDPFDIFDRESERLLRYFEGLSESEWSRPSRCAGWSVRDVVAHLEASERYNEACLEGGVQELLQELGGRGAVDVDTFNAILLSDLDGVEPPELIRRWRASDAETRRGLRDRADGEIDSSVGPYSARLQAFHLAGEVATHADDVHQPVEESEREWRRAWRVRFSRFALAEAKPELVVRSRGDQTLVESGSIGLELGEDELVEAVAGRLDETSSLSAEARSLLSAIP